MTLPSNPGSNCWTQAEDLLANELAELSSVQAFLGVGDATAAKAGNMYIDSVGRAPEEYTDVEWASKFPNVLIGSPGEEGDVFVLTNRSTGPDFGATGVLEIQFSTLLVDDDDEANQERNFKNAVGDILVELTGRPLDVPQLAVQAYGRNPEEDHERMGVILSALVFIRWGTRAGED